MRRLYEPAAEELFDLLNWVESEFKERVCRLFIHQGHKFHIFVLYPLVTKVAPVSHRFNPCLEVTELMERLLAATRERDSDALAIIEHEANLLFYGVPLGHEVKDAGQP